MIEFNVPYRIDEYGDKYVATNMGVTFFEVGGVDRISEMKNGLNEHYGAWLNENKIEYTFAIKIEYEVDNTCTLMAVIQFDNETDAMAFKLVWL